MLVAPPLSGHVTQWCHDTPSVCVHYSRLDVIFLLSRAHISRECVCGRRTTVGLTSCSPSLCNTHTRTHTHTHTHTKQVRRLHTALAWYQSALCLKFPVEAAAKYVKVCFV